MGAARRQMRREARKAAMRLMKSGVPASAIGRMAENDRVKRALLKVVDAMEKRIDTGQGTVTVREGIAAAREIRAIDSEQAELMAGDAEPLPEELEEDRPETPQTAGGPTVRSTYFIGNQATSPPPGFDKPASGKPPGAG